MHLFDLPCKLSGFDHAAEFLHPTRPGEGPRLYRHPYDETWVVQEDTVSSRLGEECFTAALG